MAEPEPKRMTYAEYLRSEAASETKHEYLRGEVYAMAGGTPAHAALAMALGAALSNALEGGSCTVFGSDLRVRVEATDLSTYPDIIVVCGSVEVSALDRNAVVNPILIAEVLFDSTEAYDRGEKFAHYRRIPSLRHYLLVSQREPRLELYSKDARAGWMYIDAGVGEALELTTPDIRLETDRVYRHQVRQN
jgi:Uma2 family endonuclease